MQGKIPEAVILIGIQASGKSEYCRRNYFDTHVRINLDMLRTRGRERILLDACIRAGQSFVVDNTNPVKTDRQRYIPAAKEAGFSVTGIFFLPDLDGALARNRNRQGKARVPDIAVKGALARLEAPSADEGFDELYAVTIGEDGSFETRPFP